MAIISVDFDELRKIAKMPGASAKQVAETLSMMGLPVDRHDAEEFMVEVSPNRPDCYSVEGLGRALEAFSGKTKGLRKYSAAAPKVEMRIDESAKSGPRPFAAAAVVRNVKMNDATIKSMIQIQEKLHDTLGRRRKKVAIGIHDLSKVRPPFVYKAVKPDAVKFVPLDTKVEMSLEEILLEHPKGIGYAKALAGAKTYPLIVDANGDVLSFPPIINGELTRVTEKTTELFIDMTGTSPQALNDALNIVCCMFADRGAQIEQVKLSGAERLVTPDLEPKKAQTSAGAVAGLLGKKLGAQRAAACLEKMGFGAKANGDKIEVLVPAYRNDILHEWDLIEDVGIAFGFENFEGTKPRFATIGSRHPREAMADEIREKMIGLGFQDCITFMLSNEKKEFARMGAVEEPRVRIANPLTEETTMLRVSLLPSLLGVLENNTTQAYPQKLFEAGEVVLPDSKAETNASTVKKLCMVASHKDANLAEAKSALDALFRELGKTLLVEETDAPFLAPGRAAKVSAKGEKGRRLSGVLGELHPAVLEKFKIEMPVAAFEIFLE